MLSKLQTLISNIRVSIEGLSSDIDDLEAIPNIINVVFNSSVNSKVVTVTLDKSRVGDYPLLLKDINTGDTQENTQVWNGNVCTITTTNDVLVPFMVVVQ
jgi:hypothetical protein